MSSVEQMMTGKHQQWLSVMTQQQIGNYIQNTVYMRDTRGQLYLVSNFDNDDKAILSMHISL